MEEEKSTDLFEREIKEEHFEQNYPKFEEVVEPCQQSNSPFFNMSNEDISNSSSQVFRQKPIRRKKQMSRRCSVCSQIKPIFVLKQVGLVRDKLIIMIKLVIRGECTLGRARSFVYEKKFVHICHAHFSEALNEIYSALCIQNIKDLRSCSPQLMNNLMLTANAILPKLSTSEFSVILNKSQSFAHSIKQEQKIKPLYSGSMSSLEVDNVKLKPIDAVDDDEDVSKISHTINSNSKQHDIRCAVCFELKNGKKYVSLESDKLIIMIGCVLRDEYTIEKAQSFISRYRLYICYTHFSEAFNAICNALHIQNLNDVLTCSESLMKNLMSTVNALRPQLIVLDFLKLLKNVSVRNRYYIQMPVMELILEEPAPKDINKIRIKHTTNVDFLQRHCSVCSLLPNGNSLKRVTVEDDKLMIMVGCILREEYTIERAKSFISMKGLFSCRHHYRETLDEICKVLRIQNHNKISMSSSDLIKNLMEIVNALRPKFTIPQFRMCFTSFVAKNELFEL